MSALTQSPAWRALAAHAESLAGASLRDLFAADAGRFEAFTLGFEDLLVDFAKQRVTAETLRLLQALAEQADLTGWRDRLFAGAPINVTEGRAVFHMALRNRAGRPMTVDRVDVMPAVNAVLDQMRTFSAGLRAGRLKGFTGAPFRDVIHIGIGGSDLGPRLVCQALSAYGSGGPRVHFVSNVDGAQLAQVLARLDPRESLFIVASKSFTTEETMMNAASARAWLVAALGDEAPVARHFVALSTNAAAMDAFGIAAENRFAFWDWVGGRFSLWSAIGLPIALALGMDRFEELLAGAHAMDEHFRTAPLAESLPVALALLDVWNRNFLGAASRAVVPYDQGLALLPAYLQQAEMESNGKGVTRDGQAVDYATSPVVWGAPGTDGQHAFFQQLHQGPEPVPVDFIVAANCDHSLPGHQAALLANCLAQSQALAFGKTADEARAELQGKGLGETEIARLLPHKVFPGDRPSTTLLYRRLTPYALGRLIALYEHKIFTAGVLWQVNSFDQWGVELGKQLAGALLPAVRGDAEQGPLDASTAGLLAHIETLQGTPD